jgi:ABC-type thiamin/hydroxymethylpyrimidine transport system permease subunit
LLLILLRLFVRFQENIITLINEHFELIALSTEKLGLRRLSFLAMISTMGGITSVVVGHAAVILSTIPLLSSAASQLLSGIHVFWLIVAAFVVKGRVTGTTTGALKGLVEAFLSSNLGLFVLIVSIVEGIVVDSVFAISEKRKRYSVYIAGGISSASNVAVLQFIVLPAISPIVFGLMYITSFISGICLGGILAKHVAGRFGVYYNPSS